jgi:LPS-assembly protein
MSPYQIMRPVFMMAGVLTILGYLFSVFVIPYSNSQMREMRWKIKNDLSHVLLQEGQFNSVKDALMLYVKERKSNGQIEGILAYESKEPNQMAILSAKNGTLFQETDGIRVEFQDGIRQEYESDTKRFSIMKFDKYTMAFADKTDTGKRSPDVRELSLKRLWQTKLEDVDNRGPYWRKHKVELVKRLVQPLYNLTFMFLVMFGVLMGYYNRRGQNLRVYMTVGAALIIQSLALAFENMSGKNLWFLILYVLNVFVPVLFVLNINWKKKINPKKWFKFSCLLGIVIGCGTAEAASLKMAKVDPNAPVDFEADQVSYNHKTGEMDASGNVVLTQTNMTIETERIRYNQKKNIIHAPETIKMQMKDGTVAHSEKGVLGGDLKTLEMGKTDIRFYEGTYLGAEKMERKENGDSYLTEAVYTPCDVCEGKAPLWRLRAKSVWNDTENQDLVYKHMFLDVKDVPVAYMPYWRMPDFTVKRRSGFLSPSLTSTRELRHGVSLPYFLNIADNQNLVLTPIIAPDHFPMGLLNYQGLFSDGVLNIQMSGTKNRGEDSKEGHVRADFKYDVNENWRLSGQLYKVSTDTYFRRYQIPGVDDTEPFLRSDIKAERFGNRNYFRAVGYSFQSLQDGVNSRSIPVILPVVDYQYNTKPIEGLGLYGFTKLNMALFNTREHFKSNRLSLTQGVTLPYVSSLGVALDMTGYVRADGYYIDTGTLSFSGRDKNETYNTGRIYANLSATVRYPFVKNDGNTTQIFEPIMMLVTSSNGGNDDKIPNVDSLVFDFDDTNLFSSNRFSGYDRVETGTRINYGVQWSRFNHKSGRSISALFGQSYRFDDDELMGSLMGYDPHFSDYVGRVQISMPYWKLLYRARLDQKTLKAQKNEISLRVGSAPLTVGVGYVLRKAYKIGDYSYRASEEITYSISSQLTRRLKASGYYTYDLSGKGEPVEAGGALQYDNECTALVFEVDKSYTEDRDYKGSISFMFKVILKTLGGM